MGIRYLIAICGSSGGLWNREQCPQIYHEEICAFLSNPYLEGAIKISRVPGHIHQNRAMVGSQTNRKSTPELLIY